MVDIELITEKAHRNLVNASLFVTHIVPIIISLYETGFVSNFVPSGGPTIALYFLKIQNVKYITNSCFSNKKNFPTMSRIKCYSWS